MARARRSSSPRGAAYTPDSDASVLGTRSFSPILDQALVADYDPRREAARNAAMEGMGVGGGGAAPTEGAPILSYALPEPTSYSGTNIIVIDTKDLRPRPKDNLLKFDGKTCIELESPPQLQTAAGESLTIEAWIKTRTTTGFRNIVDHGQQGTTNGNEVFLRIHDGRYEFGTYAGARDVGISAYQDARTDDEKKKLNIPSSHLGAWVHLAGVYNAPMQAWLLYVNGNLFDAIGPSPSGTPVAADLNLWRAGSNAFPFWGDALAAYQKAVKDAQDNAAKQEAKRKAQYAGGPVAVEASWCIGGMRHITTKKYDRFFDGFIAEVRVWNVARSEAEIRENMDASSPVFAPGTLGASWRINEGSGTVIRDSSGQETHGALKGGDATLWTQTDGPIAPLAQLLRRQPDARLEAAFKLAHDSGFFDPLVFPRVRGPRTDAERKTAMDALKDLKYETFRAFYDSGQHLVLQRNMASATIYRFIPTPRNAAPQLMLVEEYALSSFLGAYGVGRTIKTFSLLPGESTKLTVRTSSKTDTTTKQSSSILDSYSQESASEFESALAQENSSKSSSSETAEAHAEASVNGSWGFGSASASIGASASCSAAREEFGKTVSNATSKHASRASANRNVQIDTTSQTTTTTARDDETIRAIQNINVGRTLNFVFRQMNQEFISLLHLVDVRIAYTNGLSAPQEYPLYDLDDLLGKVVLADKVAGLKADIVRTLQEIKDFTGTPRPNFITTVDPKATSPVYRVNKDFVTKYRVKTTGTKRNVAGLIISAKSIVMRTDDVVVEAVIGRSSALDQYAEGLQDQEIRTKRIANDHADLENRLMMVEASKGELLVELARGTDPEQLKRYSESLSVMAGLHSPTRVVGVWEPQSNGGKTAGG